MNKIKMGSGVAEKVLSNKKMKKIVSEYFHHLLADAHRNIDKGKYKKAFCPCCVLQDVFDRDQDVEHSLVNEMDSPQQYFYRAQGASVIFFHALNEGADKKLLFDLFQIVISHLMEEEDNSHAFFPFIMMNADFLGVKANDLKDRLVQMLSDNDEFEYANWISTEFKNLNN